MTHLLGLYWKHQPHELAYGPRWRKLAVFFSNVSRVAGIVPRVSFFIDGFNVYHSIKQAIDRRVITNGKWLDYRRFCENFVPLFGTGSQIAEIHYFSALATFLAPDVVVRHKTSIAGDLRRLKVCLFLHDILSFCHVGAIVGLII
jgi:hypothetical protein